ATIDRYAYASLRLRSDHRIHVRSLDFDSVIDTQVGDPLHFDGNLDLIKGCLRRLVADENSYGTGIEFFLETDAPPGSGLGASSALVVAVIGALMEWRQLPLSKYQIAQQAWEIERKDVRIAGGLQDQYAARDEGADHRGQGRAAEGPAGGLRPAAAPRVGGEAKGRRVGHHRAPQRHVRGIPPPGGDRRQGERGRRWRLHAPVLPVRPQ